MNKQTYIERQGINIVSELPETFNEGKNIVLELPETSNEGKNIVSELRETFNERKNMVSQRWATICYVIANGVKQSRIRQKT